MTGRTVMDTAYWPIMGWHWRNVMIIGEARQQLAIQSIYIPIALRQSRRNRKNMIQLRKVVPTDIVVDTTKHQIPESTLLKLARIEFASVQNNWAGLTMVRACVPNGQGQRYQEAVLTDYGRKISPLQSLKYGPPPGRPYIPFVLATKQAKSPLELTGQGSLFADVEKFSGSAHTRHRWRGTNCDCAERTQQGVKPGRTGGSSQGMNK